jgi:hypothetical protein
MLEFRLQPAPVEAAGRVGFKWYKGYELQSFHEG